MNLDELQSVQARERQTDSLQQLRESFYADAGEFVRDLREKREAAADRADDPFDSPEVNRLTDDIQTAEQTVEAIYERRVGKVVKMASLAAADMPTDDDGLTREEADLFDTLVDAIEANREHVLDVIAGETPAGAVGAEPTRSEQRAADAAAADSLSDADGTDAVSSAADAAAGDRSGEEGRTPSPEASDPVSDAEPAPPARSDATDDAGSVDAADVMGSPDDSTGERDAAAGADGPAAGSAPDGDGAAGAGGDEGPGPAAGGDAVDSATPPSTADDDVDRTTVRITDDVGSILGVDEREYDLAADDVVTLPSVNAAPLVDRDAAEDLD